MTKYHQESTVSTEAALHSRSYKKSVLKIYSEFTVQNPCQSVISIKLFYNFIEIALRRGCSPVNLVHIFRKAFHKNTPGALLLKYLFFNLANSNEFVASCN